MANPELCLSEFQNTIPTFVPAVLHTFSDYQKWYRFRTPIQNFEILGNLVFSKANQGVKSLSDIFQRNIFPKFFFRNSKFGEILYSERQAKGCKHLAIYFRKIFFQIY